MTTFKPDCGSCLKEHELINSKHCLGCVLTDDEPTRYIPAPTVENTSAVLPMVIGLYSSSMGSGKTTVAEELVETYGFTIVRFADCLKAMTVTFFEQAGVSPGMADKLVHDPELKEQPLPILGGKTPRWAMQTLGTEWGRDCISRQVWVQVTLNRIAELRKQGKPVVVDDMRFPEEIDALWGIGAENVKVFRPGAKTTSEHQSEGQLDGYDFSAVLVNDLHVAAIPAKVRNLMLQLQS